LSSNTQFAVSQLLKRMTANSAQKFLWSSYSTNFLSTKKEKKIKKKKMCVLESIIPKIDFFVFFNFGLKLGHFKVQTIFWYATNTQA
jgi:hypothetical protein